MVPPGLEPVTSDYESDAVPKLAIEKPSLNTEERLFQVEIIDSKKKIVLNLLCEKTNLTLRFINLCKWILSK